MSVSVNTALTVRTSMGIATAGQATRRDLLHGA